MLSDHLKGKKVLPTLPRVSQFRSINSKAHLYFWQHTWRICFCSTFKRQKHLLHHYSIIMCHGHLGIYLRLNKSKWKCELLSTSWYHKNPASKPCLYIFEPSFAKDLSSSFKKSLFYFLEYNFSAFKRSLLSRAAIKTIYSIKFPPGHRHLLLNIVLFAWKDWLVQNWLSPFSVRPFGSNILRMQHT